MKTERKKREFLNKAVCPSISCSEPHRIMPAMGKLILKPSAAADKAAKILLLIRAGLDVELDCIETLDEILMALTSLETHCLMVYSCKGAMTVEMVKRLRFERGLDVRPNAKVQEPLDFGTENRG